MQNQQLDPKTRFIFIAMMESAIKMKEKGQTKEIFVDFAKEIWESMELTPESELKALMNLLMKEDLEKFRKSLQS